MSWFVTFTMMLWTIFITQGHLTSFKRITKDSDKPMDSLLIMYFWRLRKVLLKNVICCQKVISIPKYNLSKIKINSCLSMISKINKPLVSLSSTKRKLLFLMLKVNWILSIILMTLCNNKKILFKNSPQLNINRKSLLKNLQPKGKAKNNWKIQMKSINNKISKKPWKRLILAMSSIEYKEFLKSHNKFLMFVTCKNKMEVAWLQCLSFLPFSVFVFLSFASLRLIQKGK